MRGVFIKHISPDSPAAHNGTLRTGDRILEVCVCASVCVRESGRKKGKQKESAKEVE